MKARINAALLISIAVISSAGAQTLELWGLKVGSVLAEQKWDYSPQSPTKGIEADPLWGLQASGFMFLSFSPRFGLIAELRYVQRGRSTTVNGTMLADNPQGYVDIGPVVTKHRFHYLCLPILAQLRLGSGDAVPYLGLGPRLDYLLSTPGGKTYERFATWEFGGTIAAGVEISSGSPLRLLGEISYDANFTRSFVNEYVSVSHRSVGVMLGVSF